MPRPPRRTREKPLQGLPSIGRQNVESNSQKESVPSSPPKLRRGRSRQTSAKQPEPDILDDTDSIPSTIPTPAVPTFKVRASRMATNTIAQANRATAVSSPNLVRSSIQVSKTPSPAPSSPSKLHSPALIRDNVLATSTPSPRGRKRDSGTAFEEDDFEADLLEEASAGLYSFNNENRLVSPKLRTARSDTPIFDEEEEEDQNKRRDKGKSTAKGPDDTITFNYSSSPEQSPSQKRFGLAKKYASFEDDPEDNAEEEDQMVVEKQIQETRPKRKQQQRKVSKEQQQQASTATLRNLLPKRRKKPEPRTKAKSKKASKPKANQSNEPEKTRNVLKDVTREVLDDEQLEALNSPSRLVGVSFGDDMSEDELGVYIDSSARSSMSIGPPTPPKRGKAKIKPIAKSTSTNKKGDETSSRRSYGRRTYGRPQPVRQHSANSNSDKENEFLGGPGANENLPVSYAKGEVSKADKKEIEAVKQKFKEVDDWALDFEDVDPSPSSDGIIKNGR